MRLILALFVVAAACGSSSPAPNGDGGGGGGAADLASTATCQTRADCRLYSSYCVTAACQCLALGRNDADPPCSGGTQSCLVDPCSGKSADCVGGRCVVTQ
jgi:hypothetical protein